MREAQSELDDIIQQGVLNITSLIKNADDDLKALAQAQPTTGTNSSAEATATEGMLNPE